MINSATPTTAATGDPDPYDWRLAVKTVLAFAVLLFLADVLL